MKKLNIHKKQSLCISKEKIRQKKAMIDGLYEEIKQIQKNKLYTIIKVFYQNGTIEEFSNIESYKTTITEITIFLEYNETIIPFSQVNKIEIKHYS